ncbi:MAG: nitrogenase component 1 [Myxococcota bacterium]
MTETPRVDRSADLERFALKGLHLGKMTGISVATHAIPDSFLLMHTGVGCKYKTAAQVGPHDWGSHPNRREAWTQVGEVQLIKGSAARIAPFARAWWERRRPNYMVCVSAYFIELTGEDCRDVVDAAAKSVPCDMAMITTAAPNGGFYEGYASVILDVLKKADFKNTEVTRPKGVAFCGYLFDRYEPDQQANLEALDALVKVAGGDPGPVLFSGRPYAELLTASSCAHLVCFPYMGRLERKVKRTTKRTPIQADLPIGVAGTVRFVRNVAEAVGGDQEAVEAWVSEHVPKVEAQLNVLRDHSRNLRIAIFADTPLAAGLLSLCIELGVHTPIVGLRDKYTGGSRYVYEVLERNGLTPFPGTQIIDRPSLRWTRDTVAGAITRGELDGLIGSSHECNLFTRRSLHMQKSGVPRYFTLEMGFPSDNHHYTYPVPTLGLEGAAALAQRILEAHTRTA